MGSPGFLATEPPGRRSTPARSALASKRTRPPCCARSARATSAMGAPAAFASCRGMAPIVDGLISEYEGSVAIRRYDVNNSKAGAALARGYDVQYVPTFVFVDARGTVVNTIVGETSEDALKDALDRL